MATREDVARPSTNHTRKYRLKCSSAHIDVPISVAALRNAKPGYPWACWLANEIKAYAKRHPEAFPHPVKMVYVIGSVVYIISAITDGRAGKTYRYRHNLLRFIREFDRVFRGVVTTPQKRAALKTYLAWLADQGIEDSMMLKMSPGDRKKSKFRPTGKRQGGQDAAGSTTASRGKSAPRVSGERTIATGAFRRAQDAGLYAFG